MTRLALTLTAAILRRKLLQALTCGGCSLSQSQSQKKPQVAIATFKPVSKSDRLGQLILDDPSESGSDGDDMEVQLSHSHTGNKSEQELEEFHRVVSMLHPDGNANADCRPEAALEIRRMAKEDADARETLAMLGAIPPLIGMLDAHLDLDLDSQITPLYALLNLAIGNDMNKAAIVKAGAVHKMLGLIRPESPPEVYNPLSEAIVANFLSLSALDANKQIIGSSGAVPFLIKSLRQNKNCRLDALRALFNLSIVAANSQHLIEAGIIDTLLTAIGDMEVTDHALATLSNLVASSAEARQHLSRANDSIPILIDVLGWTDAPSCQEKSAYILMVMAHKSHADRAAMCEAGISGALLELTLIGTPLAQKRSSRILEMMRSKKGKEISESSFAVSAPMAMEGKGKAKVEEVAGEMSDEKMAVKQLVQQSLHCNMRRIARRANLPEEIMPVERLNKVLAVSSTSKSLPF
ncbi:ARM repeat superfamily protein [Rhynchospora pubera]|uniref:ARM repeat superfamily protein n=1 Tax=Rhynchospora pubera TaxID=906938 RepID=A0AAV8BSI4_9POAL|nr:ARM repeat superfamily protein [Rhynchospora pubera]